MRQVLVGAVIGVLVLAPVPGAGAEQDPPAAVTSESPELPEQQRNALFEQLDQAQQQLDASRARLLEADPNSVLIAKLDEAQRALDFARSQLSGQVVPPPDELSHVSLRKKLLEARAELNRARQTLIDRFGSEANTAHLDDAQGKLDATEAWLEGDSRDPLFTGLPSKREMERLYATAKKVLADARKKTMSAATVDKALLRQLDEAEQALDKARADSEANGILK